MSPLENLEMQKAVIAVILFVLFSPHTVLILGKKRALQSQAETQRGVRQSFPVERSFNRVYKSYAQSTPCKASVLVSFLMCEKAS